MEDERDEMCPVCGDKGSGYHYGLFTCESCKGFFKRTVQNKKTYTCVERKSCTIDKTQRKRCPFCRFQKCLLVGMKLEAVRSDRMRGGRNQFGPMYKLDRALRQQKKALLEARRFSLDHHREIQPVPFMGQLSSMFLSSSSTPLLQHTWTSSYATAGSGSADFDLGFLTTPHELESKPGTRVNCSRGCDVLSARVDQLLCSIVEWARTSVFFQQLQVSDQMKLLQNSWSELLVLDTISNVILSGEEGDSLFPEDGLLSIQVAQADSALTNLIQRGQYLVENMSIMKVDYQEFVCMKCLILYNPDVSELENCRFVAGVQEQVRGALLDHTLRSWSQHPGRFSLLLLNLSELRGLGPLLEDFLLCRHRVDETPCNSLLRELLHAKRGQL